MFKCRKCKTDCRPIGTNIIGLEIQEYDDNDGWVSTEKIYDTKCKANAALKKVKKDNIHRRIYDVFENRKYSKFEKAL